MNTSEIKNLLKSPVLSRILRIIVMLGVGGIIFYQLWQIGWEEVIAELPTQVLFYLLIPVIYSTLPIAEMLVYRLVWKIPRREIIKASLIKRVYNEEVINYSGEVFLYTRGKKLTDKTGPEVMRNIRDNTILSAINSNLVALVLVGILLISGIIPAERIIDGINFTYVWVGLIFFLLLVAVIVQFRQHLFSLPLPTALKAFGILNIRFLIHHAIIVIQWAVVLPETPLETWLLFIALYIVLNRIPFLPGKDLFFVWAGIELSRTMEITTAGVASMLLVSSVIIRLMNLTIFMILAWQKDQPETYPSEKE